MSKNIEIVDTSTEQFCDLAKRSFSANWNVLRNTYGDSISYLIDDADFMSFLIQHIINHISNNFKIFTEQEGNNGNISGVNVETVAECLVRYSWGFY
ncbi:hypothetical protein [Salmonella enterica]|uniref:hypothetical protein n=1 Tax=Salmonella enterica TaxID=28901 RepID=UPI001600F2A7|nr:hypothetical protein [Salmonella enterica]